MSPIDIYVHVHTVSDLPGPSKSQLDPYAFLNRLTASSTLALQQQHKNIHQLRFKKHSIHFATINHGTSHEAMLLVRFE